MTPHQLQRHKLAQAFVRLLRRAHHCMQARRLREQLQHHTDQAAQMREWAQVSTTATEWHTRQAAIATASLRAMGALGQLPQPGSSQSQDQQCSTWATPRVGALICLASAGIVVALAVHIAGRLAA